MAASSQVELTEAEKAFLPFMTNDLYEKNHSVIVTHFPLKQTVGQRLVDHGLLTIEQYGEMCNLPDNLAGIRLIHTLSKKGNDSMATFYEVLVSARGERDVDAILQRLEDAVPRSTEVSEQSRARISMVADSSRLCTPIHSVCGRCEYLWSYCPGHCVQRAESATFQSGISSYITCCMDFITYQLACRSCCLVYNALTAMSLLLQLHAYLANPTHLPPPKRSYAILPMLYIF